MNQLINIKAPLTSSLDVLLADIAIRVQLSETVEFHPELSH